jgi:ferrous iron transport protein B
VIAAVYREVSPGWALFVAAWSTGLAFVVATGFYQAAFFPRHPASSTGWIPGLAALVTISIWALRIRAEREHIATPLPQRSGATS